MRTLGRRENDSCMSASELTFGVTNRITAKETVIAVADATKCDSLGFQPEDHGRQVNQAAERRQVLRLGPPVVAPRLSLTDKEEYIDGMVALAVPVTDMNGRLYATLSFQAPVMRIPIDSLTDFLPTGSIPRTEVRGCRMSLLRNFVSHFDLASLLTTACNAERQQRAGLKAVSRFEPLLVVEYQPPRLPGALRPSAHGWRPFTQPLPTTSYLCSARSHPWKPRGQVIGCGLRIRSRFEHQRLPC